MKRLVRLMVFEFTSALADVRELHSREGAAPVQVNKHTRARESNSIC